MNKRKVIIKDICCFNAQTIGSKNNLQKINYLDTSSIVKNKILNIQSLDKNKLEFPSRAQRKVKKNTIIYSTVRPEQEHFGIIEFPIENLIGISG